MSDGVTIVVQARMGSSRLPGKVLRQLGARVLIDYPLARLTEGMRRRELRVRHIVLATSESAANDPLVEHVRRTWPQVEVVRGPEDDVLTRFVTAIRQTDAAIVIRATGDCPLINIEALEQMLAAMRISGADIVNYRPGYEYADKGLEVVSAAALLRVAEDPDLTPLDREHVTARLYRQPDRFRVHYIDSAPVLRRGDLRLTVDTPSDLNFFETLLRELPLDPVRVNLENVIEFLDRHPAIASINATSGRKSTLHERARLGFRCDGGTDIGLGHVVGCVRLATLLAREAGVGAEFVVRDHPATIALIKRAGFAVDVMPSNWSSEQEATHLVIKAGQSDWAGVVFNLCKEELERFGPRFLHLKEQGVRLVFLDHPLPPWWSLGDVVINALPHPDYAGYEPAGHAHCFDGLEYFLPGNERPSHERRVRVTIDRVLISMGGGDALNLTGRVIDGLVAANFRGYVDVVLGAACPHVQSVREHFMRSGLDGAVEVDVNDLSARMQKADLGFSALGLTSYEMAYQGLPALLIAGHALNDAAAQAYVARYQAAIYLGQANAVDPAAIAAAFGRLETDVATRTRLAAQGAVIGRKRAVVVRALMEQILGEKKSA